MGLVLGGLLCAAHAAQGATSDEELRALRAELKEMRASYEQRIAALENRLDVAEGTAPTPAVASPNAFNPSIGLVLDVMHGSILGQHAFGLAFVAYVAVQYHQRLRVFPPVQQAVFVAALVFLYLVMMLWIYNLLGSVHYGISYVFAALTSALLWPWLFVILRDVRRRARVT